MDAVSGNQGDLAVGVEEAANRVSVSKSMMEKLVAKGEVPSRKVGRRTVIIVKELAAWLAARPKGGKNVQPDV